MAKRKSSGNEYDNSRPFDVHKWSDYPEVNRAVDHIYGEIMALEEVERQHPTRTKKYVMALALDLYAAYLSDPTLYISYSRNHNSYRSKRYNALHIKPELLAKTVDLFVRCGYAFNKPGVHAIRRQSRVRAEVKFIELIDRHFRIKPLMITRHEGAETIILRDESKKIIEYKDTDVTRRMRDNLKIINGILDKTMINIFLSDTDLNKLNQRMITGEVESDIDHEEPRGALDFNRRCLYRVFNNGSFNQGGRFYGGWWQGIPREYRKFIKINHMITVEPDFSGLHINLLYALKKLPMPYDDPYSLEGFPEGTREVVKRSLLTIINAGKGRDSALKAVRQDLRNSGIKLPDGMKLNEIMTAFEEKHSAISEYFYTGSGVYLQRIDSIIAEETLLSLAKKGVPALPLHDSFRVCYHQEKGLIETMRQAFHTVTGRFPDIKVKPSLVDDNMLKSEQELQDEFEFRMKDGRYSPEFEKAYNTYVGNVQEWKAITGRDNIFSYNPNRLYNKETY